MRISFVCACRDLSNVDVHTHQKLVSVFVSQSVRVNQASARRRLHHVGRARLSIVVVGVVVVGATVVGVVFR